VLQGYTLVRTGVNASTTGNQYGIYDMSGGAWEYVMGNMVDSSGNYYSSNANLSQPDSKYYDSYAYSASIFTDHARGKLGDATKEILKTFGYSII
jgi:formylglycine-generating enzyme required for sulfatase activity